MNDREMNSDGLSCLELYTQVNSRMVTALMLHDQMADMYDFLNLHGFKRLHEYQYLSESIERRKLKRYVLNHHNKLIMDEDIENPKVIPVEWFDHKRFDVTPQVRGQSIKQSFQRYKGWEKQTKEEYCHICKLLLNIGHISDYMFLSKILEDVDTELKYLDRLCIELESCGYNIDYILTIQDELHKNYKEKTKELSL